MTFLRALGALLLLLPGCATPRADAPRESGRPPPLPVPPGAPRASVVRVVDGDTVWLAGGPLPRAGARVRVIGIDAPELAHGSRPAGCFGPQARDWLAARLRRGDVVEVMSDRDRTDRYGRRLLYIWTPDGTFLSEDAVWLGYARVLTVPPNTAYAGRLRVAERAARTAGRGLWGACPAGAARDGPPQPGRSRIPWRT